MEPDLYLNPCGRETLFSRFFSPSFSNSFVPLGIRGSSANIKQVFCKLTRGDPTRSRILSSRVADPNPDPPDPHVLLSLLDPDPSITKQK
jgi:hypothetical protein